MALLTDDGHDGYGQGTKGNAEVEENPHPRPSAVKLLPSNWMQILVGCKQFYSPVDFKTLPVDCQNFIAFTAALLCCICCAVKTVHANFSDRESKNVWTKDATKQRFPKTRTKGGGHHVLLFFIYALPLKIWSQT